MKKQAAKKNVVGEWDNVWKSFSTDSDAIKKRKNAFTRGDPDNIYQFWQKAYFHDFQKLIKNQGYKLFLELGSGRGTTSMFLADSGDYDITMVDLSENAFKTAQQNFQMENLKVPKFVLADVEETGLDGNSYDCIYNIGLLEHFYDPSKVIKESYRLLKNGGMIFMPIVPDLPLAKSSFARFVFNFPSLLKQTKLNLFSQKKFLSRNAQMVRTSPGKDAYLRIAREMGFINCCCISYNPYWKVNNDGWFEKNITLQAYKLHHDLFKKTAAQLFFCKSVKG